MNSNTGSPAHQLPGSPSDRHTGAPVHDEAPNRAPLVGVVVVNWRRPEATRGCLEALSAMAYRNWFAVVVDNGAADFGADALRAQLPGAEYARSAVNLGFAAGSNLGMRAALARGAEWVWFLNDDATPEPNALDELLAAARRPLRPALLGAKIVQQARPERLDSVALDVDLGSGRVYLLGHDEVDRGQYDHVREPLAVTACALLVRRDACERLGGFDERYFAYLEDADICLRARAAGLRVAAVSGARVRHDRPPATRGRQSPASLYYACRNHLALLAVHAPQSSSRSRLRGARVVAGYLAFAMRGDPSGLASRVAAVRRGALDHTRGVMGPQGQ
jgi:GT2 family glycosyltransferase